MAAGMDRMNDDHIGESVLPPLESLKGLDRTFARTRLGYLVIAGICLAPFAMAAGKFGFLCCKDPRAKKNARILFVGGLITTGVFGAFKLVVFLLQP